MPFREQFREQFQEQISRLTTFAAGVARRVAGHWDRISQAAASRGASHSRTWLAAWLAKAPDFLRRSGY